MRHMLRHPLAFHRDHRFTLARASDYLDEDLDEAGRARVERHAGLCPRCRALLTSLRRTVAAVGDLRAAGARPPAPGLASRVIARLRAERAPPG